MSLAIDEVSAEVQAPETPAPSAAGGSEEASGEKEFRRQCDLLVRVETRAARLRAD
jgi:hypothetical protein